MALSNFYLTDAGNRLLARAQTGETLSITRAQAGDGTWPEGTTYANITALASPVKDLSIISKTQSSGQAKITIQFSNSGVGRPFQWTEFGLWAEDPDYPDDRGHDILYGTAYAEDTPVPIESALTEFIFNVLIKTGQASNITVTIDSSLIYLTQESLDATLDALRGKPNGLAELGEDGKVPAEQLPEISNVKTNCQLTIPTNGWVMESADTADFPCSIEITYDGVLDTHNAEVTVDKESIQVAYACGLCPTMETRNNGLKFWSRTIPETEILCHMTLFGKGGGSDAGGGSTINSAELSELKNTVADLSDIILGDPEENDPYYLGSLSESPDGSPGIYLSSQNASFTDSTTLVIQVCLKSAPEDTISLDIRSGGVATVAPQRMTFTPDNYSTVQYMTLSYAGEPLAEAKGDTVTITAHGGNYEGIVETLPVNILPTGSVAPPEPGDDDSAAFAALQDATVEDFSASICLDDISIDENGIVNTSQSTTFAALLVPAYNGISAIEWEAYGTAGAWVLCGRGTGNLWAGFGDLCTAVNAGGEFNNGEVTVKSPITTIVNDLVTAADGRKYRASRVGTILRVYENAGATWVLRLHLDIPKAADISSQYYEQNVIGLLCGSNYHKPRHVKVYKG